MMPDMTIQAVVFDIGGILEITPSLAVSERWESRLGLAAGEINKQMEDVWHGGGIGTISEADVHRALAERLGFDERQVDDAFVIDDSSQSSVLRLNERGLGANCDLFLCAPDWKLNLEPAHLGNLNLNIFQDEWLKSGRANC